MTYEYPNKRAMLSKPDGPYVTGKCMKQQSIRLKSKSSLATSIQKYDKNTSKLFTFTLFNFLYLFCSKEK